MRWIKTIAAEVFGLFVDDGSFAAAILAWLLLAWLVLPRTAGLGAWGGVALFGGLAAILLTSAVRRSRQP